MELKKNKEEIIVNIDSDTDIDIDTNTEDSINLPLIKFYNKFIGKNKMYMKIEDMVNDYIDFLVYRYRTWEQIPDIYVDNDLVRYRNVFFSYESHEILQTLKGIIYYNNRGERFTIIGVAGKNLTNIHYIVKFINTGNEVTVRKDFLSNYNCNCNIYDHINRTLNTTSKVDAPKAVIKTKTSIYSYGYGYSYDFTRNFYRKYYTIWLRIIKKIYLYFGQTSENSKLNRYTNNMYTLKGEDEDIKIIGTTKVKYNSLTLDPKYLTFSNFIIMLNNHKDRDEILNNYSGKKEYWGTINYWDFIQESMTIDYGEYKIDVLKKKIKNTKQMAKRIAISGDNFYKFISQWHLYEFDIVNSDTGKVNKICKYPDLFKKYKKTTKRDEPLYICELQTLAIKIFYSIESISYAYNIPTTFIESSIENIKIIDNIRRKDIKTGYQMI